MGRDGRGSITCILTPRNMTQYCWIRNNNRELFQKNVNFEAFWRVLNPVIFLPNSLSCVFSKYFSKFSAALYCWLWFYWLLWSQPLTIRLTKKWPITNNGKNRLVIYSWQQAAFRFTVHSWQQAAFRSTIRRPVCGFGTCNSTRHSAFSTRHST